MQVGLKMLRVFSIWRDKKNLTKSPTISELPLFPMGTYSNKECGSVQMAKMTLLIFIACDTVMPKYAECERLNKFSAILAFY